MVQGSLHGLFTYFKSEPQKMNLKKILGFIKDEEISRKLDFLQQNKLFDKIPRKKMVYVLESLQERDYVKGEKVFSEGEIGRALFLVASGRIDLYKKMSDGSNRKVASVNPGEFFGEMALLEERPRTTAAIVGEDAHMFLLFKIKLDSLLYSKPDIGVVISTRLAKILSARLRETMASNEKKDDADE